MSSADATHSNLNDDEDSYFGLTKRQSQIHELKPVSSPPQQEAAEMISTTFEQQQMDDTFELSEPSMRLELPIKPSF